jgi:undecaprenyl-diphosphatase
MLLKRAYDLESQICSVINHLCHKFWLNPFFKVISRLGDGVIWYTLTLLLPFIFGTEAVEVSVKMAISGLLGLLLYKLIKLYTERPRPYTVIKDIMLGSAPLDKYSFPSGHTLHAVSFTFIAVLHYPILGWIFIPFAFLVALSRIALGLHYPTDVIAGAIVGYLVATFTMTLF